MKRDRRQPAFVKPAKALSQKQLSRLIDKLVLEKTKDGVPQEKAVVHVENRLRHFEDHALAYFLNILGLHLSISQIQSGIDCSKDELAIVIARLESAGRIQRCPSDSGAEASYRLMA
jgi:hypothetical protein